MNFRPTDRLTSFLMPPSVEEWLPQRHLARFVVEVVDGLDLSAMSKSYRGSGSASYHPAVLLSLLVYGCATGVFSSRKLERATYDSVAFRFIAANDHPDHDTIATFRRRFLKEIEALFVKVLLLAREMGVLKMGTVALDDFDFYGGLLTQLANVDTQEKIPNERGTNFMLAMVRGIGPKDEIEAMMAAQMAAVHMTTMTFARRLAHVDNILQQDSAERAFNKLARTFAVQVEALKRYRTGGEQKVTVQHVTVNEGGRAIVGSVSPQVGGTGDAGKS